MSVDLSRPIVPYLEGIAGVDAEAARVVKANLPKVKRVFEGFAVEMKKASLMRLSILDLVSNQADLSPGFIHYVDKLDKPKDKAVVKSRVRSLLRLAVATDCYGQGLAVRRDLVRESLPPWMEPLWHVLPRCETGLTNKGRHVLGILLHVSSAYQVGSLEELLVQRADDLAFAIREVYESPAWKNLDAALSQLRRKLGLSHQKGSDGKSLPLSEWPPIFKRQWDEFEEAARLDPDDELVDKAEAHGIKLRRLEESTLKRYRDAVAKALRVMPWSGDLGLKDLLRVSEITVEEDGEADKRYVNELVEVYRTQQKALVTPSKRANKDSVAFVSFVSALKTMAAFHGMFVLRKQFHAAYRPRHDEGTRVRKREIKKAAFSAEFIDGHIDRLWGEFRHVVRNGSFKSDEKSMRLCLFFVVFLTLRFMGFRQQAVRDCKLDENLFFSSGGSVVTFTWPRWRVKNKRPIVIKLEREVDTTHKLLIAALSLFRKHVYDFIVENRAEDLHGRFFVKQNCSGRFVAFREHTGFYQWFCNATLEFLPMRGVLKGRKQGLHPHFMRGYAIDWLLDYGLSAGEVADLMNISEQMVRQVYAGRERAVNTRAALDSLQVKRLDREALRSGIRNAKPEMSPIQRANRTSRKHRRANCRGTSRKTPRA